MVSTLHANFIVTDRGGRAADVRALGDLVRATVADRFGVQLAYEIEFVGDWDARGTRHDADACGWASSPAASRPSTR